MARTVLTIAGAVIGAYVGNAYGGAQLGAAIGGLIGGAAGNALTPNTQQQGPRLSDLKAPAASFGTVLPYIDGVWRTGGYYAWYSDKREISTTTTEDSKGGPGVDTTLFTYEIDCLIVVADNPMAALRRVWSTGKLVWTNAEDADAGSLRASAATNAWREIRFHGGGPNQQPDTVYETAVGIGNAPAYRERATVFIEGLNLGSSGQLPVLTFEVLSEATVTGYVNTMAEITPGGGPGKHIGSIGFSLAGFDVLIQQDYGFDPDLTVFYYQVAADGTVIQPIEGGLFIPSTDFRQLTLRGQSDVTCIVNGNNAADGPTQLVCCAKDDIGTAAFFDVTGETGFFVAPIFARKGSVFVLGASGDGTKRLLLYSTAGGSPIAATAPMADLVISIALSGFGKAFALDKTGANVYQIDLATMTLDATIPTPITSNNACVVCDEGGGLIFAEATGHIYAFDGVAWTLLQSGPLMTWLDTAQVGWADDSLFGANYESPDTLVIRTTGRLVAKVAPGLDQVVSRLCLRTGLLTADDIDVTDLAGVNVRGLAVSQVSPVRQTLETLMGIYLFDAVEGEKIKFVMRGHDPQLTIGFDELGASESTDSPAPLPLRRVNDIEQAARVTVTYANVLNDMQDGSEAGDRVVTSSTAEQTTEVALALEPIEAKRAADSNTMDIALRLLTVGPIARFMRAHPTLEPTDVIEIVDRDGSTFRTRIEKTTLSGVIVTDELALDDASILNSNAVTAGGYTSSSLVRAVGPTQVVLLDIPILRDADDSPGFYAAFKASPPWPGATLYKSTDDITYAKVLDATARAIAGTASTTLGAWDRGTVFDERNALTVDVDDGELASVTRTVLLTTNANAMLVGSEIIQFRDATLVTDGVYKLSGLIRGRRGTEWAMDSHVANERVVLLTTSTLRRVLDQQAEIGVARFWKAVTIGKNIAGTPPNAFTDTGVSEKPFSPVSLRKGGDASEVSVTWKRRTRYSTRFCGTGGINVPLGEVSEKYTVELRDPSDVVVATEQVTTPAWTRGSAVQTGVKLTYPAWGLMTISTELVGVYEPTPYGALSSHRLVKFDATTGVLTAIGSATIAQLIYQLCHNGDAIYAATADTYSAPPNPFLNGRVVRLDRSDIATVLATYTAATPGDPSGVAFDGTNVWITERFGGNIRKLDATTLASISTHAFSTNVGPLTFDSGYLWISSPDTNEVIQWDIAGAAEVRRLAIGASPGEVIVVGSFVYVTAFSGVKVFDKSSGALVETRATGVLSSIPGQNTAAFGSYVAISNGGGADLYDASTGLYSRSAPAGTNQFYFVNGALGSDLLMTVGDVPGSPYTAAYELAPPALSGYSVTVYQEGANARGYPATLEL